MTETGQLALAVPVASRNVLPVPPPVVLYPLPFIVIATGACVTGPKADHPNCEHGLVDALRGVGHMGRGM